MNEQYKKLVNAIFPDDDLTLYANKTNVSKKDIEHICIEIIARVLGNGTDLSKETIQHKIKKIVENDELKNLLVRLDSKYGISSGTASKALGEMLPNLFRKVVTLDNNLFTTPIVEKHPVQYKALEEAKPIEELKKEIEEPVIKQEPSVDDVFKNIESNVTKEEQVKQKIVVTRENKKKKSLFSKKEKKVKEKPIKVEKKLEEEKRELSFIEKICIIVVLVALVALIGTIIFLAIKQRMSMQ